MQESKKLSTTANLKLFFIVAFVWAWTIWVPLIPQVQSHMGWHLSIKLCWIGLMGPGLAAMFAAYVGNGSAGIKKLLLSLTRWRMPLINYFLIYVGTFYFFAAAAYLSLLFGVNHAMVSWHAAVNATKTPILGLPAYALVFEITIIYTLCEEMGWRGFALPRLTTQMNALMASIMLGVIWAMWHMPLIYVGGNASAITAYSLFLMFLHCVLFSMILSWFYFKAQRSFLVTGLLHGYANTIGFLFPATASLLGQGPNGVEIIMEITVAVLTIPYLFRSTNFSTDVPREGAGSRR